MFRCKRTVSAHLKHAKGMSLRYGVIVSGNLMDFLPRKYFIIRVFSPWNGERFLSLGQSGQPSWEGGGGIVWLAAWKLVSNDAKRTVAPPNAKHSTLPQGCFLGFCFYLRFRIIWFLKIGFSPKGCFLYVFVSVPLYLSTEHTNPWGWISCGVRA